jgi:hypothetical protein
MNSRGVAAAVPARGAHRAAAAAVRRAPEAREEEDESEQQEAPDAGSLDADDFAAEEQHEDEVSAAAPPALLRKDKRVLRPGDAEYEAAQQAAQIARNQKRAAPAHEEGRKRASVFRDNDALAASLRGEKMSADM